MSDAPKISIQQTDNQGPVYVANIMIVNQGTKPDESPQENPSLRQEIAALPLPIAQRLQEKFTILVERPEEIEQIIKHLLNEKQEPSQNIIVLWGPGGIGKTALALFTCCCTKEILQHFTGGIFWVDVGEEQNVLKGIQKLYKQLSDSDSSSDNAREIATELLEKWSNRPTLIVLDDVRTQAELDLFYSSTSEHCTWLITTRRRDCFAKRNPINIQVSSPRPDEALKILALDLKQKWEVDSGKVEDLAAQLYEWPLLIDLVRKKIYEMPSNTNLNDTIDKMITRLKKKGWHIFEEDILKSMNISFECLTEDERDRFTELLIFPVDVPIPLSILEKLWDVDEWDVEQLCETLYNLSLLEKFYLSKRKIRLSSYLYRYLRQIEEINKKLPAIHNKLLKSYQNIYSIQLEEQFSVDLLEVISDEAEKVYLDRFYEFHWKEAGL